MIDLHTQLIAYLLDAQAMERRSLQLLSRCSALTSDERIAAIYRTHRLETEEHARTITERLRAHRQERSSIEYHPFRELARELELATADASETPARLAMTAYAFENLEIAAYHLLQGIAERAGDPVTVSIAERILEQEEATAELLASTFDRALEASLG